MNTRRAIVDNSVDNAMQLAAGGAVSKATVGQLLWTVGGCVTLGTALVMAMTFPKTPREVLAAILSSLCSSFTGGIIFSIHYRTWEPLVLAQTDPEMIIALLGIAVPFFVAALPGWIIVRSFFIYAEARKTMSLLDMIVEIKNAFTRSA